MPKAQGVSVLAGCYRLPDDRDNKASPPTHQAQGHVGRADRLQRVVDPAVVAGVAGGGPSQAEDHSAVAGRGQCQQLLQAADALVGHLPLLPLRQGVHGPEGVVLAGERRGVNIR